MKFTLAAAALVGLATSASANLVASDDLLANPAPATSGLSGRSATGDFAFSVFAVSQTPGTPPLVPPGTAGVANIANGITTVGSLDTFAPDPAVAQFAPDVFVSSAVTAVGSGFELTIEITTVDPANPLTSGDPFLQAGLALGGQPVNQVGFDLGDAFNSPNFPAVTDAIDFGDEVLITSETFEVFADGASLLAGNLAGAGTVGPLGGLLDYADQLIVGVPPGGDLFGIAGGLDTAVFVISYEIVPEPGVAFAGIALSLGFLRRRRA